MNVHALLGEKDAVAALAVGVRRRVSAFRKALGAVPKR
jgi:hypothetical protein